MRTHVGISYHTLHEKFDDLMSKKRKGKRGGGRGMRKISAESIANFQTLGNLFKWLKPNIFCYIGPHA